LYDRKQNLYITEPASSTTVEQFLRFTTDKEKPGEATSLFLQLTFTFNPFFEALLEQMTRTDSSGHNLANPEDPEAIQDTFTHSIQGGKVSIRHKSKTLKVSGLRCRLMDKSVEGANGSKPPFVKLVVQFDFGQGPSVAEKRLMRQLVAMDWSKLARFGVGNSRREDVAFWIFNVNTYLLTHTLLDRGERIRSALVQRHVGKSPKQLSVDLRNDIDAQLITSNHWGQEREDLKREKHQRLLSDLLGTLHQQTPNATPVLYLRFIAEKVLREDVDRVAALALQYGVGHCEEHAICSFSVLRALSRAPNSKHSHVILSGNANIDHSFVLYNIAAKDVIETITTNPRNSRKKKGSKIQVFNLKNAIRDNPDREGFVMDPYLDRTVMKATAAELLRSLNAPRRVVSGKDTDFLAFQVQHPEGGVVIDDMVAECVNPFETVVALVLCRKRHLERGAG